MPRVIVHAARIPKLSRFGWLMGLYAENHARLTRLFEPGELAAGRYVSTVGDGVDVTLDVVEHHAYLYRGNRQQGADDAGHPPRDVLTA